MTDFKALLLMQAAGIVPKECHPDWEKYFTVTKRLSKEQNRQMYLAKIKAARFFLDQLNDNAAMNKYDPWITKQFLACVEGIVSASAEINWDKTEPEEEQ